MAVNWLSDSAVAADGIIVTNRRRCVRRSELFMETALGYFPAGGSSDGRPSFELFEQGPLLAVEELCALAFDEMAEVCAGIRAWTTIQLPYFPPMTFFALLDTTGVIELIDVDVDTCCEWESPGDSGG